MAINPDTTKIEMLEVDQAAVDQLKDALAVTKSGLLRPNGEPVPAHWTVFKEGELVTVKDTTFKVKAIGESYLLLEPAAVPVVGAG